MYPQMDALLAEIRKLNIPYVDMDKNIEMLNKYNVNALSLNSLEEKKIPRTSCNYSNFQLIK